MSELKKMPSIEQVQKTVADSRRRRQELELASLDLEDLIMKIEEANLQQRRKHLAETLKNT